MIDKSFIEKIENMSIPAIFPELHPGLTHSSKSLSLVSPPTASPLTVHFLAAIIDYCASELEENKKYIIHIKDESHVSLLSRLSPAYRQREVLVIAEKDPFSFRFGEKYSVEQFIINLQANFVADETTAQILKLVGNMTSSKELATKDDGITQRVEARVGLAKVENVTIPNPVILCPRRTFPEVEQPESPFVLRLDSDHRCALYEADGGAWKLDAVASIRQWLENSLKSIGARVEDITILA